MPQPISFRWDEEFIARIDRARDNVPRSAFVRRAVERALSDPSPPRDGAVPGEVAGAPRSAAPAEQPYRRQPGPNVNNIRSTAQSKRDVRPIPKGKR